MTASRAGMGLGQCRRRSRLHRERRRRTASSVLPPPAVSEIPVTAHVAVGTDIIHMHPDASGAAIGEGSLRDFRYFVSNVARLAGGVYLNCGSAVILPEVFLKAVALVRNHGISRSTASRRSTWTSSATIGPRPTSSHAPSPASARATRSSATTNS